MPTTLTNGIQLPDKGSVDWYNSMQSNYNLIDTHLGDTNIHVTAEDKANWNSKADASHTHTSSELTDIGDYATKQYVDNSISGLVDNAPAALDTLKELSTALNDDANFASTVTTALAAKADSAGLATVATSGSYNDLSNKPTINDSTITIQKNGSTVDTFTTNGSAKTINISVPTKTSDLTNDSGFSTSADRLPIGSYIQFAGSQAPDGFLVCNGGEISRTTYSALFAVIGTTYGSGDGSTTFNLPDLTDRFLQGSTTVGTYKSAGLPNITGVSSGNQDLASALSGAFYPINPGFKNSGEKPYASKEGFDASRCSTIYGNSTTVQPPALTCLICIKY